MTVSAPRLALLTHSVADPSPIAQALAAALSTGDVASVLLRLEAADERTLINHVKAVSAVTQPCNVALVVAVQTTGTNFDLSTVAARGGADGVHADGIAQLKRLRDRCGRERIVGIGPLTTRHDAMAAGEAGADYLMFGATGSNGQTPSLDETLERAAWWAEIFETPCIAVASSLADCGPLAATGAEFVGLAPQAWMDDPAGGVASALAQIAALEGQAA